MVPHSVIFILLPIKTRKGNPGSRGSWVKGKGDKKEILYPDLDHSPPIGPHWDYESPDFPGGTRLYPDGTWEFK